MWEQSRCDAAWRSSYSRCSSPPDVRQCVAATTSERSRWGQRCPRASNAQHIFLPGSYPLSQRSTPFNVDYYGARIRSCYEGWVTYLHGDYGPGDIWNCVGWHWSGDWKDAGSQRYIQRVRGQLDRKPWLNWANQPG